MAQVGAGGRREPGDLGRRIEQRRRELALSLEQVAERAGMALGYLEYLQHHAAEPPATGLVRLAAALETTVSELLGGTVEVPAGQARAAAHPTLEPLDRGECRRLLGNRGVGGFVFSTERGPIALPVNYRTVDDDIVFRTAASSSLANAAGEGSVSFEVDHIDDAMSEGWSVLVTGRARTVHDPIELQTVERLGIEPWAGGDRDVHIRLHPTVVSGRRIRTQR